MNTSLKILALLVVVVVLSFAAGYAVSSHNVLRSTLATNNNSIPQFLQQPHTTTPSNPNTTSPSTNPESINTAAQTTSANWAGYIASGGSYTSVSGSWTVGNPSDTEMSSADATWVGIGGVSSNDLIQVGTQNVVEDGQVQTSAFYELLPYSSVPISSINVSPGDSISASVTETSPDEWNVSITDNTSGSTFSTQVSYDSSLSSAEWIEEAPSTNGISQIPLDGFGTISFSNCLTTSSGSTENLTSSNAQIMSMDNSLGENLASVSGISSGNSFTITRTSAISSISANRFHFYPGSIGRQGFGLEGF